MQVVLFDLEFAWLVDSVEMKWGLAPVRLKKKLIKNKKVNNEQADMYWNKEKDTNPE